MGTIRKVEPVALIAGILYASLDAAEEALVQLIEHYGRLAIQSDTFEFTMTDYYESEMGVDLHKFFCCFERPVSPGDLPRVKHTTNDIEIEFAEMIDSVPKRRVNIDPGYITPAKLVLASTKDFSHRVYLGESIYGEVTLRSIGGSLTAIDTTYPDYQTPLALDFFNRVRRFVRENRTKWILNEG